MRFMISGAHARNEGKRTQVLEFGEEVGEGEGLGGMAVEARWRLMESVVAAALGATKGVR